MVCLLPSLTFLSAGACATLHSFDSVDLDGSGSLDLEEMKEALIKWSADVTDVADQEAWRRIVAVRKRTVAEALLTAADVTATYEVEKDQLDRLREGTVANRLGSLLKIRNIKVIRASPRRLDSARLGSTRLDSARLSSTRLGSTRLDSTRLGSARLDSARLDSARLDSTPHAVPRPFLTRRWPAQPPRPAPLLPSLQRPPVGATSPSPTISTTLHHLTTATPHHLQQSPPHCTTSQPPPHHHQQSPPHCTTLQPPPHHRHLTVAAAQSPPHCSTFSDRQPSATPPTRAPHRIVPGGDCCLLVECRREWRHPSKGV